jgi:broad specificity phosphatase PhoE
VDALLALPHPMVVVTHFVAINVAVGIAEGDDRVACFEPDNCSVTVLDVEDGRLRLVRRGTERATRVL